MFYLKQLLLRLGKKHALSLWEKALAVNADNFLVQILSTGWHKKTKNIKKSNDKGTTKKYISDLFGSPVEKITGHMARELIEKSLPIPQIHRYFGSLNYEKQITGYEKLHLFNHPKALLAETAITALGKQGELMIYDIEKDRQASHPRKSSSFAQFCSQCKVLLQSTEVNWLNCLIDAEIIRETDTEIVFNVSQCECARYFRDHHPTVGYLLNCSLDESDAKAYNKNIQLQITSTIMEGGKICDFRYYLKEPIC